MTPRSFSSGTLLWVDDDFALDDLDRSSGEIDNWRRTFGTTDNRVFRMMNLNLEIATTSEEAFDIIGELMTVENQHRYVQAVVDLRIPGRIGQDAQMKNGLDVARKLKALGIPFYLLSSSSSAMRELSRNRLDRTPYYQKIGGPSPTMMPEPLARRVLTEFRNNVTWLDLSPVVRRFDPQSIHPLSSLGEWSGYFPFFAGYRDFVERWEARTVRVRSSKTVLRSPGDHCDGFVMSCIAVILSGLQNRVVPRVVYLTGDQTEEFANLVRAGLLEEPALQLVVRFRGTNQRNEVQFLESILHTSKRCQTFIVIPQDESSDQFLRVLSSEPDATYDDLPQTRFHDRPARLELIQRCSRLVFEKQRFSVGEARQQVLHDIYLRSPEILVDPVHWAFLAEAEDVADAISDPVEVIEAFEHAVELLRDWDAEDFDRVLVGRPVSYDRLLRPAHDVFSAYPERQRLWTARAFHDWLTRSWQSPFGLITARTLDISQEKGADWEDHCLEVALHLSHLYGPEVEAAFAAVDPEAARHLSVAARFLNHDTIRKMIDGRAKAEDWQELESERWPHQEFPMPTALHRRLKTEGRYLWVQTDLLDRAGIVLSGREALQRVEARAERHSRRLDWLERAIPTLPEGWRQAAQSLHRALESRRLEQAWQTDRTHLWNCLFSIVHNASPTSYIFWSANDAQDFTLSDSTIEALGSVQGPGQLFGRIRGPRSRQLPNALKFVEPQPRSWMLNLQQAAEFTHFMREFDAFAGHAKQRNAIDTSLRAALQQLDQWLQSDSTKLDGSAVGSFNEGATNGLIAAMFDQSIGLQRAILDRDFKPNVGDSSALRHGTMRGLPIDLAVAGLDAAEKLRSALLPILYFDGYHLISMIYDLRNEAKNVPPELDNRIIHKLFELFLLGFEGLVTQLKWCLMASGRHDLADPIPSATLQLLKIPTAPIPRLDSVFKAVGGPKSYAVYTLGIPGNASVQKHTFDMPGSGLVYYERNSSQAAE